MFTKDWPKITERTKKGVDYWILDSRRYQNGVRSGSEEYFNKAKYTLKQVQGRADVVHKDVRDMGHEIGSVTSRAKIEAFDGIEQLKPYPGETVARAVEFYVEHLKREKKGSLLLSEAASQWLQTKVILNQAKKYSNSSLSTAKRRIGYLTNAFPDQRLSEVTASAFEDWLKAAAFSTRTISGIKSVCSEFFKWCMKPGREWIVINPAGFMRVKHNAAEVQILSTEQMKTILDKARLSPVASQAVPYILVSAFAGLRPSEAQDLTWEDIDFETKEITVVSRKLRGEKRFVPISQDLANRLQEHKGKGPIVRENWEKNFRAIKVFAGFDQNHPFPNNGFRHSFASYWLALNPDRPRLAEIMGNSVDVIREYYRQGIAERKARAWWALLTSSASGGSPSGASSSDRSSSREHCIPAEVS